MDVIETNAYIQGPTLCLIPQDGEVSLALMQPRVDQKSEKQPLTSLWVVSPEGTLKHEVIVGAPTKKANPMIKEHHCSVIIASNHIR